MPSVKLLRNLARELAAASHSRRSPRGARPPGGRSRTMLTVLRPRLVPNFTAPGAVANSVSSPPRPTLTPGWKWVPRWRTMISPALTTWPPNRLTPSRCELESRPLRELEAPFLCAMSTPPLLDSGDLEDRQLLTVTLPLVIAGLVLELVDADLGTLGVLEHLAGDGDLLQVLGGAGDLGAVDDKGDGQRDLRAGLDCRASRP